MYHLAVPNQTIPDWVQHLPEPERSEKIDFIRQYGSPNVFSQFQPHVTLACDDNATALSAAFAKKAPQILGGWLPEAVILGPTGPCGTVRRLNLCHFVVFFSIYVVIFRRCSRAKIWCAFRFSPIKTRRSMRLELNSISLDLIYFFLSTCFVQSMR